MERSRFHRKADAVFLDRVDAGRQLATSLERFRDSTAVVLALPRGGVPVAFEVARTLSLPLDVIVVRKLGLPFQPEVAMGAIGEGGARVVDRPLMAYAGVSTAQLDAVERKERRNGQGRLLSCAATRCRPHRRRYPRRPTRGAPGNRRGRQRRVHKHAG
jgi:putative phosphoribosyl transferase